MSLLDDIVARASQPVAAGLFPAITPDTETYTDYASGFPIEMTRRKDPFPEMPKKPIVPALSQMAPQAGILAPMLGGLNVLPAAASPPSSPDTPAPDAAAAPIPPGEVPMPTPRPTPTDLSSANRDAVGAPSPPVDLITPAQKASLAQVAPSVVAEGETQPAQRPFASPFGPSSILDRLQAGLGSRSNTLLALAAGFAGAPNIGQGISRAAAAAIPARAADIKEQLTTSNQRMTTGALIAAGVPVQLAIAAQANPAIMQSVAQNYLGDRKADIKEIKTKDAFGNESSRLVAVNPYTLKTTELGANPANGGDASTVGGKTTVYAKGVTPQTFDQSKVGDDYLQQFSPEVQSAVKAYIRGDSLPTGRQQLAQTVKMVAQKYGDDIGMPVNDQLYAQRKTFANSLGDTKSGVGMQVKGFQQGLQHMMQLSDKLVKAANWNGLGLEPLANMANAVRNQTVSQQDILRGVQTDAHLLAGETGKLFSGTSGGGVREREEMAKRFGDPNMSGPAAAGALESAMEAMEGGLTPLENRRDQLFPGAEKPRGGEFRGKAEQDAIAKIRKNIAILRGQAQPSAPAAAPTNILPPGAYMWTPQGGIVPK